MTEKNYTIPINEEFDKYDGCPICRLHEKLERQSLEYIMGAAMMEPDVRIETNKKGFCGRHYRDMLSMKNRLSLALMLETHLAVLKRLSGLSPKTGKKELRSVIESLAAVSDSCFLYSRIDSTLKKYCSNIVFLWKTEPVFREKLLKQPLFCYHHAAELLKNGLENLNPKLLYDFASDIFRVTGNGLDEVSEEVSLFCKSFDYRFSGQDIGSAKQASEHAIDYLIGKYTPNDNN